MDIIIIAIEWTRQLRDNGNPQTIVPVIPPPYCIEKE